ncbi:lipocalin family protein, partial [Vibrio vulnificus]|uniref:lipocalin family protein n=1 Tax=Vibrio vulnificus TaxID=672 RepID=UPI001EEA2D0B
GRATAPLHPSPEAAHSTGKQKAPAVEHTAYKHAPGVAVLNKGFLANENQWKEAEGKAYFVNGDSEGYLKVSFFGPFYGSYVVFALDKTDYQYAFVSGPNTDYLWLLARTPTVDQSLIDTFVAMAKERGFDTERLIFVEQK